MHRVSRPREGPPCRYNARQRLAGPACSHTSSMLKRAMASTKKVQDSQHCSRPAGQQALRWGAPFVVQVAASLPPNPPKNRTRAANGRHGQEGRLRSSCCSRLRSRMRSIRDSTGSFWKRSVFLRPTRSTTVVRRHAKAGGRALPCLALSHH